MTDSTFAIYPLLPIYTSTFNATVEKEKILTVGTQKT